MSKSIFKYTLYNVLLTFLLSCKGNDPNQSKKEYAFTNDLVHETSPYLLQHAHNPVDWKPWSKQALETAAEENKLVLVSIGYSSCHWCHVMEEETFENEAVAKLMNENFVNIKVDREERPDVDQIYMTAIQLLRGQGGWPLNIITLPDGKPLYGGTYHTTAQWIKILTDISTKYKTNPEEARAYADRLAAGIEEVNIIEPSDSAEMLNKNTLTTSISNWKSNWDMEWGGNKGDLKFMLPVNLSFLLDYATITHDAEALSFVKTSLDKMAMGGVYDHIGGGFFRYSTDAYWKIPHFEKMLYDNAQLVSLYSKAYITFKDPLYKTIAEETLEFIEQEMKNPKGGYYAAIDADSEGEEGKYYVWTQEELKTVLQKDFDLFREFYGITPKQVWENNSYVIHTLKYRGAFAKEKDLNLSSLNEHISKWQKLLMKARNSRIAPRKDDKIITSWNALLVSGFVDAYKAFHNEEYLQRAIADLEFITNNSGEKNKLVHSYKKESKKIPGFLEDYAFLANAALDVYEVTLDTSYLNQAIALNTIVQEDFNDPESGLFVYSAGENLISKILKIDDGVIPSPNAVAAHNLFTIGHIMYTIEFTQKAQNMLASIVSQVEESPSNYAKWNSLLLKTTHPFYEIAVVGDNAKTLVQELHSNAIPNSIIIGSTIKSELPLFQGRFTTKETLIFVCEEQTCKLPVATVNEALKQLSNPDYMGF
tara:strand:- start:14303 stop:16423 length:2121 start_codon:yes stop_codon:yes gene_type:complete